MPRGVPETQQQHFPTATPAARWWLVVAVASLVATLVFWKPLWTGGGLIGGDVYSYYFPQKVFYVERLRAGELPLWNNRTGFGYPLVAESQTGVFYPPTLLFYCLFDVNTAYSLNHLLHYGLAFLFAALYVRSLGLSTVASLLAALVYTYGWFPPRSCVEWAVIGGAWLPLSVWCVERLLASGRLRFAWGLTAATTLQLLAGHFHLAWVTVLLVGFYAVGRAAWATQTADQSTARPGLSPSSGPKAAQLRLFHRPVGKLTLVVAALAAGFGLAAVQILPTWELKQHSQRRSVSAQHDPGIGVLPGWYVQQVVVPWRWYSPLVDRDAELNRWARRHRVRTNQVEAHLYFGLFPLLLAAVGVAGGLRRRTRWRLLWLAVAVAFLTLATGWCTPLVRAVPGFNFFEGLGRYTVAVQLAVAVLAAAGLDDLLRCPNRPPLAAAVAVCLAAGLTAWSGLRLTGDAALVAEQLSLPNPLFGGSHFAATLVDVVLVSQLLLVPLAVLGWRVPVRFSRAEPVAATTGPPAKTVGPLLLAATVLVASTVDFWLVSRLVGYTDLVDDPPIRHVEQSPVARALAKEPQPVRLLAPGANFPTVLGVSCWPVYFTFGPAEYERPEAQLPRPDQFFTDGLLDPDQLRWLDRAGVTHVLSFRPLRVVAPSALRRAGSREPAPDSSPNERPTEPTARGRRADNSASGRPRGPASDAAQTDRPSTTDVAVQPGRDGTPVLELLWAGVDPVLNGVWARGVEPVFLYRLAGSRGRLHWAGDRPAGASARIVQYDANRVVVDVETAQPATLVLTDLAYPGWTVTVDGRPQPSVSAAGELPAPGLSRTEPLSGVDRFFRAVRLSPGRHRVVWTFRPKSLRYGLVVSVTTLVVLLSLGWLAVRPPRGP